MMSFMLCMLFFIANAYAQPLSEGVDITLRNTLQDPGQPEVTYASLFGQADDAFDEFATLSNANSEFPMALGQPSSATGLPFDLTGLYDIDLTETSIEFTALPDENTPFWSNVLGLFPPGKFDRYYLTFSEPHNITSAASNHTSVNLRIDSETTVVVEISEGFDLRPGASFFISLNMAEELTNEEKARAFNTGLIDGDREVIKWIRDDYIQHNLGVSTGKAPIAGFYGGDSTGITVDVHRSFEIGDFVFAQTTLGGTWGDFFGSGTDNLLYEVWRFEDGFAVEHWDNIVAVIDDMDGTTQTDGVATPATDLGSTSANRALLEEMAQTLFVDGDWTNVRDYFDIDNYVQHSVGAGTDGAFLASLEGQTGVSFYDDVKFIHVLGNFGLVMSQGPDITGQDPDNPYAYYDLFRMENGLIVEHWDAIQMIPPPDQWAHTNGKWGDDAIAPPVGADITLRNTLQDAGQPEVTYPSLFGQTDDAFDEFGMLSETASEFPTALAQPGSVTGLPFDISGLYDINFTQTSVEFTLLPDENDPFWVQQFGVFPAGKFDRYYFTFAEPHNITSAASNDTSVELKVLSDTEIVVEISEGYNFNPGISFFISFNMLDGLTNEEKARGFNEGLVTGDPSALKWMRSDYVQHNLTLPTGKDALAAFYPGFPFGITVDIHRSFESGDIVMTHTTFGGAFAAGGPDQIIIDVWRFEDGFAVEHWDNIGDTVDDMDGTTQTDGAVTPATDLDQTDANQALLEEMAQTLFIDGDWTNVRDYFDLDNFVQHSTGAGPDGAFLASLEGQTGVSFYDDIKFINTLGNFGLVRSQGPDITGQDTEGTYAYYDLFRIENGLIVEHWDIIELIPPQDEWANNNGKWGDDAIFPNYSCGGDLSTESTSQSFDQDLCIDGIGFDANPNIILSGADIPTGATVTNVSLEAFFRLEGSSCESDIAIRLTDPAGNVHMINAFATCDGAGQLLQINTPIPSSYVTGDAGDWRIQFDDTNDQNSGCEYSVRFARVNYDVNESGVPVSNLVSEAQDMNIFVDGVGFDNNPSITFADPGTPADAVLSSISLEVFFRMNGSSCENEIALQLTDPAGNTQPLTAFATCNGGGDLYFANIAVPGGFTTGSAGDWVLQFDDTNDQNADYEYSPRFARLTYTTTQLEAGEAAVGVVEETVSEIADNDLFVDGVGYYFNDNYKFSDPGTPADAQLSNISLELFFRLNGNSCENEIAMELTDPAGNIQPLTAYTSCDGGSDLLSVTLDIPSGSTVGAPADWVLRFDDTNDQNADYEYSVRFGRLTYDVQYVTCVPAEEEEELQEPDDTFAGQTTETINAQMKVYPVPAHQELNVDYLSENTSSIDMQIFSADGRLVMSEKGMLQQGLNTFRLDIADLPGGHYYIHTFTEQGVLSDKIIVIE